MTLFALSTAIASAVLLFGFIALSLFRFGLKGSYSAFARRWDAAYPIRNANLWSIVTIVAAMLLAPAMIELGEGSPAQSLGFFTPVYLIVVGLTPKYESVAAQNIAHVAFASVCAACACVWILFVAHVWLPLVIAAVVVLLLALATHTLRSSLTFWGEVIMFAATYAAVFNR